MQPEARGTADAVLAAEGWAEDAPFLALNADNLYPVQVLRRSRRPPGTRPARVRPRGSHRVEQHPAGARPVVRAARGRRRRAHADCREARGCRHARSRRADAREHELLAIRQPHLLRVPRRRAVAAGGVRAARLRSDLHSGAGSNSVLFRRAGRCSTCRVAPTPPKWRVACAEHISRRDGRRHARRASRIRGPGRGGTRGEGPAVPAHARSLAAGYRIGSCRGVVGAWTAGGLRNAHGLRRRAIARRTCPARVRVPGGESSRSPDPGHRCKRRPGSLGQEERHPPGVRRHLAGAISCALPRLAALRRGDRRTARAQFSRQ